MSKSPTRVIFLWHMHQPYYKGPTSRDYLLPWVRLHGVKDYYGMACTVARFDKVKVTFNFSGILLYQLMDYVENGAQDYYGILSLRNPRDLSKKENGFIVDRFFSVNFDRFIRPNKRYLQLYQKKLTAKHKFTCQDISDLQVIFNLCWFHPYSIHQDRHLRALIKKGRDYNQEDKQYVIKKQYQILAKIMPLYRKLHEEKRIELSLTPYSHPIMPLLYDTDILKEFSYLKKPNLRFSYPEDCLWHLNKAQDIFRKSFFTTTKGSWPSEGSVSEAVAKFYADEGFRWIGTDEDILFRSLITEFVPYDVIKKQRHIIYRPYNFKGINIFFRDRNLSDAISFVYQGWEDSVFAANDLLEHFKRTHCYVKNILKKRAITIIMDGENAWEYYQNNGVDFLEAVYAGLEKSKMLVSTTPSEFLSKDPARKLERLACGSWINSDFGVWIGSKKNNHNWYILRKLRNLIDQTSEPDAARQKAFAYFHTIEGSDWNWWNTFEDMTGDFKKIFLSYVKAIYKILAKIPPSYIM